MSSKSTTPTDLARLQGDPHATLKRLAVILRHHAEYVPLTRKESTC